MTAERKAPTPAERLMTAPGTSAIAPKRLGDIAVEVDRLSGAVHKAMSALAFSDEPSGFASVLERRSAR
jgi:hypothetical protein